MKLSVSFPARALNKAYLKQSLKRAQIELFKANLARMFERIRTDEHEEHLKNIVSDFLKDTWYKQTNEHEQKGAERAEYGKELLKELSARLMEEFGGCFPR